MNLPDIEVDQDCYDRIMGTFSGTDDQKAAAYEALVKNFLIDRIASNEIAAVDARMRTQRVIEVQAVMDSLPQRPSTEEPVVEAPPVTPGVSPTLGA